MAIFESFTQNFNHLLYQVFLRTWPFARLARLGLVCGWLQTDRHIEIQTNGQTGGCKRWMDRGPNMDDF